MSWLQEQKAKADKEQADREAEKDAKKAAEDHRDQRSRDRAKRERETKFADLEGRMCWQELDGKRRKLGAFHSEVKNATIIFFAGEVKLGEIQYWLRESERYDNDGCSYGTGDYYETSNMWLYLSYIKKDGTKAEPRVGGECAYYGHASDDYLGEYLLNFVKP